MKFKKTAILWMFLMIMLSGCTDELGIYDFSGRIELKPSSDGWAYRNIASSSIRPVKVDPEDRLGDYQRDLELQKAITVGKSEYIILAKFKTDRLSTGHDFLDLLLKTDRFTVFGDYQVLVYDFVGKAKVETVIAKDSESGDDWSSLIADPKSGLKKRNLERKGEFVQYFREPTTQRDCIIEVVYQIESEAVRAVNQAGEFIEDNGDYQYEELKVDGSARMNIGFRQCLSGKRIIGDRTIVFFVFDWDLDGRFSEEDMVWSDYTNKYYRFGEEVRLTDSWSAKKDNTYRLSLIKPQSEQEKYALEIALEKKGKR